MFSSIVSGQERRSTVRTYLRSGSYVCIFTWSINGILSFIYWHIQSNFRQFLQMLGSVALSTSTLPCQRQFMPSLSGNSRTRIVSGGTPCKMMRSRCWRERLGSTLVWRLCWTVTPTLPVLPPSTLTATPSRWGEMFHSQLWTTTWESETQKGNFCNNSCSFIFNQVYIGNPSEFPFLRNRAVQVQPGHENHVEVSGVKISADPAIISHSLDKRKCKVSNWSLTVEAIILIYKARCPSVCVSPSCLKCVKFVLKKVSQRCFICSVKSFPKLLYLLWKKFPKHDLTLGLKARTKKLVI